MAISLNASVALVVIKTGNNIYKVFRREMRQLLSFFFNSNSPDSIYKCQICKTGRLYRQQSKCSHCEQPPYWAHFLKVRLVVLSRPFLVLMYSFNDYRSNQKLS
jgi:hypothetical protein